MMSQYIETVNAVLGHTVMAKKMQNDSLYKSMMNDVISTNQNLQNDLAVFDYAATTGDWGAFGGYVGANYDSSADYWRVISKSDGTHSIEWDGKDAKGFTTEQVSSRLKGDPNTNVKVTIENLVDGKRRTLNIKRERIAIPGIAFSGMLNDSIGYVRHADFTDGCYDDMRSAIERLRAGGKLKGLVLDYRNNGGGILQEAVKIVSLFTPTGTEVVSTKGHPYTAGHRLLWI